MHLDAMLSSFLSRRFSSIPSAPARRVVVITGGSAGVGRATAIAFAREGARVAVLARGAEGLAATCRDIEAAGGLAMAIPTDVADERQVEAAASEVEARWGGIDVWVNNAMATIFAPFEQVRADDFRRATEVCYLGAVWGTQAALRRMKPRNRGVVVQVGSALAYRSIPLQAAYCGAKSALRGFTDSLRSELLHEGSQVRLTMVQLPALNTPQFDWGRSSMPREPQPVGQVFQPEVAARAITWASRHPRRELWVGLSTVKAIIGTRLIPGLLDRYLARTAHKGQLTQTPREPGRPDNLYEPVPGDAGAHGRFDERAAERSWQLAATTHRSAWWLGLGAAALVGGAAWWQGRRQR